VRLPIAIAKRCSCLYWTMVVSYWEDSQGPSSRLGQGCLEAHPADRVVEGVRRIEVARKRPLLSRREDSQGARHSTEEGDEKEEKRRERGGRGAEGRGRRGGRRSGRP